MSGVKPPTLSPKISSMIPRALWFESIILESEARSMEALERLKIAEQYLERLGDHKNVAEKDYYWKVLSQKGSLLDFLGWLPEAIEIEWELAEMNPTQHNAVAIQVARLNMYRNLSQYKGPSEAYLQEAVDAYKKLCKAKGQQENLDARRLVNKMIFDKEGDFIFQNSNGNMFPDHTFAANEGLFGIEIRVFPTDLAALASVDEITVSLEGADGDEWVALSGNILKIGK